VPTSLKAGAIVRARLEKIGKNAPLEPANDRRCILQDEDLPAVVSGNRFATLQSESTLTESREKFAEAAWSREI
jgi:hypothetical protein